MFVLFPCFRASVAKIFLNRFTKTIPLNDKFLQSKLQQRKEENALRSLHLPRHKIDFCSNDYLGIATNKLIHIEGNVKHGSGGSRLLSGNYELIEDTEKFIAGFHEAEAGLIFNSGYDANTGLLSAVPQKSDFILYDKLSHASLRDGARLSMAQSFSFIHNSIEDLERRLSSIPQVLGTKIFVVTESVFSMDGDSAPLSEISKLCERFNALLIVDEAHATAVVGERGTGLIQQLKLQHRCFARIHTFGKGVGTHGAIVLGSDILKEYLINFARSFIYTTALPESSIAATRAAYQIFPGMNTERNHLNTLISYFQSITSPFQILKSNTPIQVVVIPGNNEVRMIASKMQENNLDVRAILYPTVPKNTERLRIVLHSFNTIQQLENLSELLQP